MAEEWWHTPLIPGTWEAEAGEFLRSSTARATQRNSVLKNKTKTTTKNENILLIS